MKALLICLCFSGCASTSLYGPKGKILFTQANARELNYSGNGVSLRIVGMDHLGPTLAGGRATKDVLYGVSNVITATGAAVATSGLIKKP